MTQNYFSSICLYFIFYLHFTKVHTFTAINWTNYRKYYNKTIFNFERFTLQNWHWHPQTKLVYKLGSSCLLGSEMVPGSHSWASSYYRITGWISGSLKKHEHVTCNVLYKRLEGNLAFKFLLFQGSFFVVCRSLGRMSRLSN